MAVATADKASSEIAQIQSPRSKEKSLAYEHTVGVELPKQILSQRIQAVREACSSREALGCTVLDISVSSDLDVPSGRIRVRLVPSGVDPLIQIAADGGKITSQNTHAEDLAEPIADTDRELKLLATHRDRLSDFLNRKDLRVDQEISLSKEIAVTQTQIDALNTQRANLQRRADTDLLTMDLSPPKGSYSQQQAPIRDAVRSFTADFRDATAQVIRFTATLIPWLLIIVPSIVLVRLLWRSITKWLTRREQRR